MGNEHDQILIIGAGVAGLVLAQGLKHRGIPFKVFERNDVLSVKSNGYRFRCEAAGLEAMEEAVSPELWDLVERTHAEDSPPIMTLLDPHTSETRAIVNTVEDPSPRAQRCYPFDRRWLRELCCIGIEDDLSFGKDYTSYNIIQEGTRRRVRINFTDNSTATGRLLVAADGVRSKVRQQILPDLKLVDVDRMVCWGRSPYTDALRAEMPKAAFDTHLCAAIDSKHPTRSALWSAIKWPKDIPALSNGKLSAQEDYVFWVVSTEAKRAVMGRDSTSEEKLAWVESVTAEWDPGLRTLFMTQDADALSVLPVYSSCPDLPEWKTEPCVTLVGDAIHAMAPTGGVGGRTAIEDARDLCLAIAASQGKGDEVWLRQLGEYEQSMRARAAVSIEQGFRNAKRLWAGKDWWEYERSV